MCIRDSLNGGGHIDKLLALTPDHHFFVAVARKFSKTEFNVLQAKNFGKRRFDPEHRGDLCENFVVAVDEIAIFGDLTAELVERLCGACLFYTSRCV